MTKAALLNFVKSMMDTQVRLVNDPQVDAAHRALAVERFSVLMALIPAVEALDVEKDEKPAAEAV